MLVCCVALSASQMATASSWELTGHSVSVIGNDVVFRLSGGSSSSCIPTTSTIQRTGPLIALVLTPPPDGSLCFSAFRAWEYSTAAYDLPAGSYDVEVFQGDVEIGGFDFDVAAAPAALNDSGFMPTEGMWWNSEEPGTGLSFNVDNQGRWFAALYVYDEDGVPTFLTMQGDALSFNLHPQPSEAYATGVSPLILSEGGQCLGCPWTEATISDSGESATLQFQTRTRATLTVGSWVLDLTPLPQDFDEAAKVPMPALGSYHAMTIDGPQGRHVVTVKGAEMAPGGFTGQTGATLKCVDCRTVGNNGAPSDTIDAALKAYIEGQIRFVCNESTCIARIGDSVAKSFIDSSGQTITTYLPGIPATVAGTRIELRKLPNDWRP